MRKQLVLGVKVIVILLSLLMVTTMKAQAAVPPELDLQVVSAPNYRSSPCPLNNTNSSGGFIDHAAHHRGGGGTGAAPVSLNEEARAEITKQLTDSSNMVSNLMQIVDSKMK